MGVITGAIVRPRFRGQMASYFEQSKAVGLKCEDIACLIYTMRSFCEEMQRRKRPTAILFVDANPLCE